MTSMALVARPDQFKLVEHLRNSGFATAVMATSPRLPKHWPSESWTKLDIMMRESNFTTCCFLTPQRNLLGQVKKLTAAGIHVLCAGPLPLSETDLASLRQTPWDLMAGLQLGGTMLHSPTFHALREQCQQTAFGKPVYLRLVSGGGNRGLLPAWWSACDLLQQARGILSAKLTSLYVTTNKRGVNHHVTLTLELLNRATAQLVVAPHHLIGGDDVLLLGSGGLIFGAGRENAIPIFRTNSNNFQVPPDQLPQLPWIYDFLRNITSGNKPLPQWSDLALPVKILAGMRLSLKTCRPTPITLADC